MKLQDILNSAKELANTIIESGLYEGTDILKQANEIIGSHDLDMSSLINDHHLNTQKIALIWSSADVVERAKTMGVNLNKSEAFGILCEIKRKHDASIGVSWDVISYYIQCLKEDDI